MLEASDAAEGDNVIADAFDRVWIIVLMKLLGEYIFRINMFKSRSSSGAEFVDKRGTTSFGAPAPVDNNVDGMRGCPHSGGAWWRAGSSLYFIDT